MKNASSVYKVTRTLPSVKCESFDHERSRSETRDTPVTRMVHSLGNEEHYIKFNLLLGFDCYFVCECFDVY